MRLPPPQGRLEEDDRMAPPGSGGGEPEWAENDVLLEQEPAFSIQGLSEEQLLERTGANDSCCARCECL